jgi:hypothetical protein
MRSRCVCSDGYGYRKVIDRPVKEPKEASRPGLNDVLHLDFEPAPHALSSVLTIAPDADPARPMKLVSMAGKPCTRPAAAAAADSPTPVP